MHRLDRDTSGVMVVAKSEAAHPSLSAQFKDRIVRKRYLALVHGAVRHEAGRIEAAIGRREHDRKRMGVQTPRRARGPHGLPRPAPARGHDAGRGRGSRRGAPTRSACTLPTSATPSSGMRCTAGGGNAGARLRRVARGTTDAARLAARIPPSPDDAWLEFTAPIPRDLRALAGLAPGEWLSGPANEYESAGEDALR